MPVYGLESTLGECAASIFDACPVNGIEKLLSVCLWLIPNRFAGEELAAEACQALLGVIRVCHENLSTTGNTTSSFSWVTVMKLIRQVEVLYEMRATHLELLGICDKYSPIAGLELMKLFVRLFFLNSSKYRLSTTITSARNYDTCSKESYRVARAFKTLSASKSPATNGIEPSTNELWDRAASPTTAHLSPVQPDPHRSFSCNRFVEDTVREDNLSTGGYTSLPGFRPWWDDTRQTETQEDVEEDATVPDHSTLCYKIGHTMVLIGEMLYLVRPIICVFALRRFGSRSWKPWLLSLGIDLSSRFLLSKGESIMKYAGVNRSKNISIQDQLLNYLTMVRNFQWTPVEQKEMKRRRTLFLIYLLRSPIFDVITKPGLDSAQQLASTIPVLGKVLGKAIELLYGAQRYYVYTSGSW